MLYVEYIKQIQISLYFLYFCFYTTLWNVKNNFKSGYIFPLLFFVFFQLERTNISKILNFIFSLCNLHRTVVHKSKFGYIVSLFVCLCASYWNVQNKSKFGYISFNFCSYVSLWNVPKKSKFHFNNPIGVCLLPHSTK